MSSPYLQVFIETFTANNCTYFSYDLHPYENVFTLRGFIAEDYRIMENRVCLFRNGNFLSDEDPVYPNDVLRLCITPRTLSA